MKIFTGRVVSKKMEKTATVSVERTVVHPIYLKRFKKTRKYHVHDEVDSKIGDYVRFVANRPTSKIKKWKIVEVVGGKLDSKSATLIKKGETKK